MANMTSHLQRFGITVAFFGFAFTLPAIVGAQAPVYLTQWGSGGNGDGQFLFPAGVATDGAGNVYVADFLNNRIQKFTDTGTYLTQWGTYGNGDGQFFSPPGVAIDGVGNIYVADYLNNRIQKFSTTGTYLTQWGSSGIGDGQFQGPPGVATDAYGDVYVVDQGNNRIQKFTDTGTYLTQFGNGQFAQPIGVATDPAGNVYVADQYNSRIQKFSSTGTYLTQWGSNGSGDGQFSLPAGIGTDAAGNVYVADTENHRIQKFTGAGTYLTQWGSYGTSDGQFNRPNGVATDAAGNVYVADAGGNRIQKFGPAVTPPIAMVFDVTPSTLNLASQGLWITGFLEPESPFAAGDIDIPSIRLNGTVAVDPAAPTALGDHDGNDVADLMVKFNRLAMDLTLSEGDNVPVIVTGTLGGQSFQGTAYIRVRHAPVPSPQAGSRLAAGLVTKVRWQTPSGVAAQSVALLYSLDGGSTWNRIARDQPNTGSYDWRVPNVQTNKAKVAVVLVESGDETGEMVDGVLGVGGAFSIEALVGVGDSGPTQFALRGVTPNPAQYELLVSFSLRDAKAATLSLLDVCGRQVDARRVDGMGPGWHAVKLGGRSNLPAGLYFIRLTQDGRSLTTRAALVR